jgi:hypothetical protein
VITVAAPVGYGVPNPKTPDLANQGYRLVIEWTSNL